MSKSVGNHKNKERLDQFGFFVLLKLPGVGFICIFFTSHNYTSLVNNFTRVKPGDSLVSNKI